jgi:hypothetical protein
MRARLTRTLDTAQDRSPAALAKIWAYVLDASPHLTFPSTRVSAMRSATRAGLGRGCR